MILLVYMNPLSLQNPVYTETLKDDIMDEEIDLVCSFIE